MKFIIGLVMFIVSMSVNASVSFDDAPQITDDVFMVDFVIAPAMDMNQILIHVDTVTKANVPIVRTGQTNSFDYPKILVDTDHDYGLTLSEVSKENKQYNRTWKGFNSELTNYNRTDHDYIREHSNELYNCRDTGSNPASRS
jgi:hypothetical protein